MKKPALVIAVGEKKKPRKDDYPNEVKLPEGFEHPPVEDGEDFEAVATIRQKKDGKFCVVALDGVPMDEDEERKEPGEDEPEPSIGKGARAMMEGGY